MAGRRGVLHELRIVVEGRITCVATVGCDHPGSGNTCISKKSKQKKNYREWLRANWEWCVPGSSLRTGSMCLLSGKAKSYRVLSAIWSVPSVGYREQCDWMRRETRSESRRGVVEYFWEGKLTICHPHWEDASSVSFQQVSWYIGVLLSDEWVARQITSFPANDSGHRLISVGWNGRVEGWKEGVLTWHSSSSKHGVRRI
jgi:hypothetical protein